MTQETRANSIAYTEQSSAEKPSTSFLTVAEAATRMGRHPETIRRYIRAGDLKANQSPTSGRSLIIEQSELEVFMNLVGTARKQRSYKKPAKNPVTDLLHEVTLVSKLPEPVQRSAAEILRQLRMIHSETMIESKKSETEAN